MKFKFFNMTLAGFLLSASSLANIANAGLIYDSIDTGLIIGADGITVDGKEYSLKLAEGTCAAVFGECENYVGYGDLELSQYFSIQKDLHDRYQVFSEMLLAEAGDQARIYGLNVGFLHNGYVDGKIYTPLIKYSALESGGQATVIGTGAPETKYNYSASSIGGWLANDTSTTGELVYGVWSEVRATDVPEPSTLTVFALGLMGLASRKFKKELTRKLTPR